MSSEELRKSNEQFRRLHPGLAQIESLISEARASDDPETGLRDLADRISAQKQEDFLLVMFTANTLRHQGLPSDAWRFLDRVQGTSPGHVAAQALNLLYVLKRWPSRDIWVELGRSEVVAAGAQTTAGYATLISLLVNSDDLGSTSDLIKAIGAWLKIARWASKDFTGGGFLDHSFAKAASRFRDDYVGLLRRRNLRIENTLNLAPLYTIDRVLKAHGIDSPWAHDAVEWQTTRKASKLRSLQLESIRASSMEGLRAIDERYSGLGLPSSASLRLEYLIDVACASDEPKTLLKELAGSLLVAGQDDLALVTKMAASLHSWGLPSEATDFLNQIQQTSSAPIADRAGQLRMELDRWPWQDQKKKFAGAEEVAAAKQTSDGYKALLTALRDSDDFHIVQDLISSLAAWVSFATRATGDAAGWPFLGSDLMEELARFLRSFVTLVRLRELQIEGPFKAIEFFVLSNVLKRHGVEFPFPSDIAELPTRARWYERRDDESRHS